VEGLAFYREGRRAAAASIRLGAASVFGRFSFLIVGYVSLLDRFISLFAQLGNLVTGVSQYQ
jgi:hypothetical protein